MNEKKHFGFFELVERINAYIKEIDRLHHENIKLEKQIVKLENIKNRMQTDLSMYTLLSIIEEDKNDYEDEEDEEKENDYEEDMNKLHRELLKRRDKETTSNEQEETNKEN